MGRLTLQLFGGLQAHREGGADSALAGRKAQALLAYLALNPKQRCTRDRLATLLWSDRGEEQARQSLRQAVRSLHKALHDESAAILVSDGDRLTLDPEAIAVDVQAFERLSAANTREALEQARALYAGDFLEGIDVRSEGFEEWLAAERARLRDLAADVQQRLTQMYVDSGEWDAAIGAAQMLLALDPLREEGHRLLMQIYDRTGRRSLALRQYRICEETLRRELDAAPVPETVRLYSEIRARNGEMARNADEGKATAGAEPRPQGRETAHPQRVERKLAAILAADIAGYGRLIGADEEGTIARIKALRRELIDPRIEEHRGRIVKTTGDGILIEFPSVVEAVRCAVEVQRGMVDRNADVQPDRRIEFRVGVNLGDIIVEGKDIYGDGVNIAARLEALAEPGGICLSRAVRDHIRDKLPYEIADLGEQTVKNIARPVRVFGLAAKDIAALPEIATAPPAPSPRRPAAWRYAAAAAVAIAVIGMAGTAYMQHRTSPVESALPPPSPKSEAQGATTPQGMPKETPPLDAQVWEAIRSSTNPADYEAYLRIFPTGVVAGLARERLKALAPARHPPANAAGPVSAAPTSTPRQKEFAARPVPPPVEAPQPPASTGAPTSTTPTPSPQQQAGAAASTAAATPVAVPQQQALVAPDLSKSVTSPTLPGAPYDGEWKGVLLGPPSCTLGVCRGNVKVTVAKNAVSGKMESWKGDAQLSGTIANDGSFTGMFGADPITGKFDEGRFKGVIGASTPGLSSYGISGALFLERVK